jgi:hypothetical protein
MFGENKPLMGFCRDGQLDLIYRDPNRSRCGRFNNRVTLANREMPDGQERLQVSCVSRKRLGRQLTLLGSAYRKTSEAEVW